MCRKHNIYTHIYSFSSTTYIRINITLKRKKVNYIFAEYIEDTITILSQTYKKKNKYT
jgi:hypothetical protein